MAQSSVSTLKLNEAKSQVKTKQKNIKLKFDLQNSQYLSAGEAYFRSGAADQDSNLKLNFVNQHQFNSTLSSYVNIQNDYSAQEQWNYLKPKEVYLAWDSEALGQGAFGRKIIKWNEADENWGLGVFQPRFTENKLLPEIAGLTGWFNSFEMGQWAGTLAVLPIFIPDFGPHHSVEDNRFVSKNPWFSSPPAKYNLNGQEGEIHYSAKYDAAKIVANPGFALKLENQMGPYNVRLALAYKPMNQVLLGFPSYGKVVVGTNGDHMDVTVAPRVVYQKLVSSDVSFKSGGWDVYGSVIGESPDRKESSDLETAQQVKDAVIVAAGVSRPLNFEGWRATRIDFGFLRVWGGDTTDKGYFASPESTLFERRYNYIEAFSLGLSKFTRVFGKDVEVAGRGILDSMQNGGVMILSSNLKLNDSWSMKGQIEYLGILNSAGRVRDGFLNNYRANDRMVLGMSYVF